ncbi:teichoic acid export ATP-binding protein TagH [Algibacter lectus]|uniref:Teichoic acid export ATP-binding protein TagH n=1 Tax=Algibacter lectus TaxID=221126 RepID=A0A090W1V8_9FLAO|nr:teichoic acid export ATP-binding protein TagH [Algibacter lectus]
MEEKDIILKAEHISKQYRLGLVGTGTISHDLNRWWHKVRGKADPYLKVGESNDRSTKGQSEYVWALQDINFEVERGEVLGIIGKNGAGKSTLLKILSKVTGPTTGEIKTRGRIASLLEVGTGFHGEMTGRENVYLNGAILGMTKKKFRLKLMKLLSFQVVSVI